MPIGSVLIIPPSEEHSQVICYSESIVAKTSIQ